MVRKTLFTLVSWLLIWGLSACEFKPFEPTEVIEIDEPCPTPVSVPIYQTVEVKPPPVFRITPEDLHPGDHFEVFGSGLSPNAEVVIFLAYQGKLMTLGAETTDADGTLSAPYAGLSSAVPKGSWEAIVLDRASEQTYAQLFTVVSHEPAESAIEFADMRVLPQESWLSARMVSTRRKDSSCASRALTRAKGPMIRNQIIPAP